jgi:hypothetical protein
MSVEKVENIDEDMPMSSKMKKDFAAINRGETIQLQYALPFNADLPIRHGKSLFFNNIILIRTIKNESGMSLTFQFTDQGEIIVYRVSEQVAHIQEK